MLIAHRYDLVLGTFARIYIPELEMILPNNHHFNISHYKKITTDPEKNWDVVLGPINMFFQTLSVEHRRTIGMFYLEAHTILQRQAVDKQAIIRSDAAYLGRLFQNLAESIDLIGLLNNFLNGRGKQLFDLPDLSYAGTPPGQDNERLTFRAQEYHSLIVISVLCKLLCPIWGQLLYRQGIPNINVLDKEDNCFEIIRPTLASSYPQLLSKLQNYVNHIIRATINQQDQTSLPTDGCITTETFNQIIFATLIVKRYVNVDLLMEGMNLLVWTSVCVKQSTTTLFNTLKRSASEDSV